MRLSVILRGRNHQLIHLPLIQEVVLELGLVYRGNAWVQPSLTGYPEVSVMLSPPLLIVPMVTGFESNQVSLGVRLRTTQGWYRGSIGF